MSSPPRVKPRDFTARVLQVTNPAEVAREITRTGCEPEGVGIMTRKGTLLPVAIGRIPLKAAPLLKQEMLAVGADSAHHREVASLQVDETSAVLLATPSQYSRLIPKLRRQPFQLPQIAEALEKALMNYSSRRKRALLLAGGRKLTVGGKTLVMGVLNVTPDSFSDGGHFLETERAVAQGRRLCEEGADILDVGGESTRPGARQVGTREELRRVLPVVKRLVDEVGCAISVDTRKPAVAEAVLEEGAHLVNDVTGLTSASMRRVLRKFEAGAVVMHMRGTPETMQRDTAYSDLRGEVYGFLERQTCLAVSEGISGDHLVVDPGLGFGKSFEGNLDLLAHIGEFRSLGLPVLVGASRKSFLGVLSGGLQPADRREASIGAAVVAALRGAHLVRVHDVAPTVKALAIADALR